MTVSGGLRVSADALNEYTLTAEQTLALYGTEIELEIYANNSTYQKNAVFVGTTQALTEYNGYPVSNGAPNPPVTYAFGNFVDTVYDWMTINRMQHTNYLIYRVYIDPYSPPYGMPFSVNLTNSINITAYGFGTSVLWSVYSDSGYAPNNDASHPYYNCSYTLYGESAQDIIASGGILAAGDIASGNSNYYASIAALPYGIEVTEQQGLYYFNNPYGLNSYYGAVSFAGSQIDGGQQITVGSQTIYIKNEGNILPYTGYTQATNTLYNKNYNQGDSSDYATYIFVQCPTLYGDYILPGGGDGPGGVDLSQIEQYLDEQTGYLQNISEESTVQTRQLIAILAKLEQIYTAIQSGSFNPSLNPTAAQTLPRLDWSEQQSAIASGTISANDIDNMTPAAAVITDEMSDILSDSGLTLFAVGLVSICAAGWFLTRGRG